MAAFAEIVKRAQERGSDTVLRMACGLQDLMKDGEGEDKETLERIQEFLDDFYQVRVEVFVAMLDRTTKGTQANFIPGK